MIPLSEAQYKTPYIIRSLTENTESNRFFMNLGCTIGDTITVINKVAGNYVVQIKDGRFGLDSRFAKKIMVEKA
ncbi:MAG: FeoA family protein [Bacillota bacterium]